VENRKLILGGVEIPYEYGLLGHSDADVLVHAIMDALLGAAALRDIGRHFPDNDPAYEGADSIELLKKVGEMLEERMYLIENIDATVIAQKPKLLPYIDTMVKNVAEALPCVLCASRAAAASACDPVVRHQVECLGNAADRLCGNSLFLSGKAKSFLGRCLDIDLKDLSVSTNMVRIGLFLYRKRPVYQWELITGTQKAFSEERTDGNERVSGKKFEDS